MELESALLPYVKGRDIDFSTIVFILGALISPKYKNGISIYTVDESYMAIVGKFCVLEDDKITPLR